MRNSVPRAYMVSGSIRGPQNEWVTPRDLFTAKQLKIQSSALSHSTLRLSLGHHHAIGDASVAGQTQQFCAGVIALPFPGPASSNKRLKACVPCTPAVVLNDGPGANKENIPPPQDQPDQEASVSRDVRITRGRRDNATRRASSSRKYPPFSQPSHHLSPPLYN